ncbi:MAG: hypothetical protein HN952_04490 [Candidatus Cloacimonetes bacterium]|jgi:hypothetical protein|nr:hypothetical protein [Candidatus Cloacimonadota bacterium]MBT6994197.1 hypothetical protein [Candidatus Cloacimonadota bacterium]MBT7469662.1 hypothetical protein [Candidatus Cloacimonadota bacterium]
MKKRHLIIALFLFASVFLEGYNFVSPMVQQRQSYIKNPQVYDLQQKNIIINSERVFNDSLQFTKNNDYQIDYQKGQIFFKKAVGKITIEFLIYPSKLLNKFSYYLVLDYVDSLDYIPSIKPKNVFRYGSNIDISGNKTILVSVAEGEPQINQSLFLKIDGNISENIKIKAQLTDSKSPITPEGNSRYISEIDNIYLKLYGKNYDIAFGDSEMQFSNTKFMNIFPKFEGVKLGWKDKHKFSGAMAISKGKNKTTVIKAEEAKQGPYYIAVNSIGVKLVPASESVFLNGVKMERGADYIVDYTEGSITFTNLHFISSASHIRVIFQYSDENFRQNLYLTSAEITFVENLKLNTHLMVQNDDSANPLSADSTKIAENRTNVNVQLNYQKSVFRFAAEGLYTYFASDKDTIDYAGNVEFAIKPNLFNSEFIFNYCHLGENISPLADIKNSTEIYEIGETENLTQIDEYSLNFYANIFDFYKPELFYKIFLNQSRYFSLNSNFNQQKYFPKIFHRFLNFEQNEINIKLYSLDANYKTKFFDFGLNYLSKMANNTTEIRKKKYFIELKNNNFSSQLFFENNNEYEKLSETYGIKSMLISQNHRVKIDVAKRIVRDSIQQSYDVADVNLHNSFFQNLLKFNSYYTLKNVEFYEKTRALEFVGDDFGVYDSLGNIAENGEYDYVITGVDYENPQPSIELNANFRFFVNPNLLTNSFLKIFRTESHLMISENSKSPQKMRVYYLDQNILLNENFTLYGSCKIQQILWIDFGKKVTSRFKIKNEKIIDTRYNDEMEKRETQFFEAKFNLNFLRNTNSEIIFENAKSKINSVQSEINSIQLDIRNKMTGNFTLQSTFDFSEESGFDTSNYQITSLRINEHLTCFWKRKYRLLASLTCKRNFSDFSGYYNEKKDGFIFKWFSNVYFSLNNYTSFSLKYSGQKYPNEDDLHKFSAEIKAEF